MAQYLSAIAIVSIPLTSVLSLAIYLSSHPRSPARSLFRNVKVALPTTRDEPLDGAIEKDAFDLSDDVAFGDGQPIEPDQFWASTRRQKVALLVTVLIAFAANIALLILTILDGTESRTQRINPVLPPALLIPSHVITIVLAIWFLSQSSTTPHWATTIHLATGISVQFLVLGFIALLPHEPFPISQAHLLQVPAGNWFSHLRPIPTLRALLPIVHLAPLSIILSIRRGPPLHIPLDHIYPSQIIDAIPTDHPSLDPSISNVCEEVQATIPEFLLFGFVTSVVLKGYSASTMDVWDLPVLTKDMRE